MHLKQTYYKKNKYEAGTDEAGRGCLAGPVYTAAVILDRKTTILGLDDSKKLQEKQRNELRAEIESKALHWVVKSITPKEIDRINILQASLKAMYQCIQELEIEPELILVDGNRRIPLLTLNQKTIIKGDGIYQSIAAASILAKTHRDEYMQKIHKKHPEYHWNQNKGYPTEVHRLAIQEFGLTSYHRKTFCTNLIENSLF